MGNTYNRVYIWCCKYGENRYCERCANKKLSASKHTGLLNSCLGKLCLHPYLVVSLISARVTLIPTRVSAHCQAILLLLQWAEKWGRCILETHLISTHCGLASDAIWQHKSRSTLAKVMACCLMALPQTMLTHHHWGFCGNHFRPISHEGLKISICKIKLKIYLPVLSHFPRAKELRCCLTSIGFSIKEKQVSGPSHLYKSIKRHTAQTIVS